MANNKTYLYQPKDVCARELYVTIDTDTKTVQNIEFNGGCNGNHQGLNALIVGMPIESVADKLDGIKCGARSTSCPDQLSVALRKIIEELNKTN